MAASLVERAVILVIMYHVIFKTNEMCLTWYWPIIFSIRVSLLILTIPLRKEEFIFLPFLNIQSSYYDLYTKTIESNCCIEMCLIFWFLEGGCNSLNECLLYDNFHVKAISWQPGFYGGGRLFEFYETTTKC
jgi:hypothetical protein